MGGREIMLNGVEILSQEVIPVMKFHYDWGIFVVTLLVATVVYALVAILFNDIIGLILAFFVILIGACISCTTKDKVSEYIQYKVTISDDVNFVEFTERYEILEQDGKIYTIRERDKNIK